LWHLFNIIASALLGVSLIDIYSIEVISWIKDTQIYKWINDLISSKPDIIEKDTDEFRFPKKLQIQQQKMKQEMLELVNELLEILNNNRKP
jgi:hypothetical protein